MNYKDAFHNIKEVAGNETTLHCTASVLVKKIDEGYAVYRVDDIDGQLILICWPENENQDPITNYELGDIFDELDEDVLNMQVKAQVEEGGEIYEIIGAAIVEEDGEGSDIWDEEVFYFYTA